jgi:bacterioferritin-associated ferredoxin
VYACLCAAVTEAEVRMCILAGARSAEEIGDRCGAGTGCGSCHERLDLMVLGETGSANPPKEHAA